MKRKQDKNWCGEWWRQSLMEGLTKRIKFKEQESVKKKEKKKGNEIEQGQHV